MSQGQTFSCYLVETKTNYGHLTTTEENTAFKVIHQLYHEKLQKSKKILIVHPVGHPSPESGETSSAHSRSGAGAGQGRQRHPPALQRCADTQRWAPPSGGTDVPQVGSTRPASRGTSDINITSSTKTVKRRRSESKRRKKKKKLISIRVPCFSSPQGLLPPRAPGQLAHRLQPPPEVLYEDYSGSSDAVCAT